MKQSPLAIVAARLQSDIAALNAIGRDPDSGELSRPANGRAIAAAREWFSRRVDAIGSGFRVDDDIAHTSTDGSGQAVVVAGRLATAHGAGPFDDTLGIVAGLEVLRCLPKSADRLAIAAGEKIPRGASCVFRLDTTRSPMLRDSGRRIGLALSASGSLDMRRACEIGEACGTSLLPMRFDEPVAPDPAALVCELYLDASQNVWPLTDAARKTATQCATVLLNLVAALVD